MIHCGRGHTESTLQGLVGCCPAPGSSPIAKFNLPLNFAGTAAHITTLVATSVAFFTNADRDTRERAFTSAATGCAGSGSLAVTFRAQKSVWHLAHSRLFGTNATTSAADFREPACQIALPLIADPSSIALCALEYSISEVRTGCGGASEIGIGQIRTCQISLIQIGPGEISA